jgi:hypothetical protein
MSDKVKLKYVLFNGDNRRARCPSDFPDCDFDERSIPATCQQIPEGRTSVDLLSHRQENGLDLWTGEPLVGEKARQWLRLRRGRFEEEDWRYRDVVKILQVVATEVKVLRAGGILETVHVPPHRISHEPQRGHRSTP